MRIEAKRGSIHLHIKTNEDFTAKKMKTIDKKLVNSPINYYIGCYAMANPVPELVLKFHPYLSLDQVEEIKQIINGNGK